MLSTLAWQGRQVLTLLSTALSIPGNHSLTRSCLLVAASPWCALCPMSTTQSLSSMSFFSCRTSGMTILSPLQSSSTTPSSSHTAV